MYQSAQNKNSKESGQIMILALTFMLIVTAAVVSLVGYVTIQIKSHKQSLGREQALNIAEAGAELAIWKLNNQAGYSGESNTAYSNGTYTVTMSNLSASSKIVKVDAYVPNSSSPTAHRTIQENAVVGTTNIGFDHAVQVGNGGLVMDNNASVSGNIYSNASIIGSGSGNGRPSVSAGAIAVGSITNTRITGNVSANAISGSTVGGDANIHTTLDNTTVTGNVSANTISNCTVTGNATYNTKSGCSVSGTSTTPNNNVPATPDTIDLPIPDAQIDDWETEATNGGTVSTQTISTSSLGPKKISGDLIVNGTLTITGTLWVTGNVTVNNGAKIQLSSSYGSLSGVLMTGTGDASSGTVSIANNAILQGSGTSGSYLLLLSQRNDQVNTAIGIDNNALSVIVYAGNGVVNVSNNAQVREITAYKIHLNNNVVLTSNSGTTNGSFPGTGIGWEILDQTWQLLL